MRLAVALRALDDEAFRVLTETHPDWHVVSQGDRVIEAHMDFASAEAGLEMLSKEEQAAGGTVVAVGVYEVSGGVLNWGTPVGGAVPQGWMATQVAKVANVDARTGEIHNMVNWGTPVGGAVPQGWVPSRLDDIQKELDAIKQKLGA